MLEGVAILTMHFERWVALLTDGKRRRGAHRSIYAPQNDIRESANAWNENPKPFITSGREGDP